MFLATNIIEGASNKCLIFAETFILAGTLHMIALEEKAKQKAWPSIPGIKGRLVSELQTGIRNHVGTSRRHQCRLHMALDLVPRISSEGPVATNNSALQFLERVEPARINQEVEFP